MEELTRSVSSGETGTIPGQPSLRKRPRKTDFRQRAHCNPLSDGYIQYPISPDHVDWSIHYPQEYSKSSECGIYLNTFRYPIQYSEKPQPPELNGIKGPVVSVLDIGCGYGGLAFALAEMHKEQLFLGLEIREKVTDYTGVKLDACRTDGSHKNLAFIRTNVMKFLPNYIRKGQIEKMFFCFPDPQFKKANWRRRIISTPLLSLYAYHMKPGGLLYFITDVEALYRWMHIALSMSSLFEEVKEEENEKDPHYKLMHEATEEGKKARSLGYTFYSGVFRRKY